MCFYRSALRHFYFRWLFAINRKMGRTTTFSDEELFTKKTFQELGVKGKKQTYAREFFSYHRAF